MIGKRKVTALLHLYSPTPADGLRKSSETKKEDSTKKGITPPHAQKQQELKESSSMTSILEP